MARIIAGVLLSTSLLWITLTVESFILRLSCKKEADFSISHKNYALTGSVIGKYTVPHLGKCVEECMANHGCKSMNYKASGGENNCELNSKIRQNSKADQYAERPGWMYISTDYSKFKIGSVCEMLDPCPRGVHCVDTCDTIGYQCMECEKNFKVRYEPFCQPDGLFESCTQIKKYIPKSNSGVYNLTSGLHYCMMDDKRECGGGGWTLAMRMDGKKDTFHASSPFWQNENIYNAETGLYSSTVEAKFPGFSKIRFTSICVGMNINGQTRWMRIPKSQSSLLKLFGDGQYQATTFTKTEWKNLVNGGGSLQNNCDRQGINVKTDHGNLAARIGIISNNENECVTPDSYLGFGLMKNQWYCGGPYSIYCGNYARCGSRPRDQMLPAIGHILIQ